MRAPNGVLRVGEPGGSFVGRVAVPANSSVGAQTNAKSRKNDIHSCYLIGFEW